MLIFIIPTSYPNPDNPVANSFVLEQVSALSKYDDCKIVVLNVQKQPSKSILKHIDSAINKVEDDYSTIYRMKTKTFLEKRLPVCNQWIFDVAMSKLYKKAVHDFGKPDVIYAHFFRAAYSALKVSYKQNIPVVVMEHSGDLMKKKISFNDRKVLKQVLDKCDSYLATTENLKKHVIMHGGVQKNIKIIPNMVDDIFKYKPIMNKQFTFLSVSRLEYDKRIDLLIRAFCESFSPDDNVVLRIGGSGSEISKLKELVRVEKRDKQIIFLGQLSRNNVVDEMERCSCFVLPSRHETFGLVWREALCMGRPVITTDHGGFSTNDWKDEYGVMIPIDSLNELSRALKEIYANYQDYDLKQISVENLMQYSSTIVGEKIYKCLNEVAKGD